MINRETVSIKVVSFTAGTDEYGQLRQLGSTETNSEGMLKLISNMNVSNPLYLESDYLLLTKDKNITVNNQIKVGNDNYQVKYIIPSGKYNQVLIKKL